MKIIKMKVIWRINELNRTTTKTHSKRLPVLGNLTDSRDKVVNKKTQPLPLQRLGLVEGTDVK